MLLADLLRESNFEESVQKIALEFRREAGIVFRISQLGIIVPNVEAAVADLEKMGLGPFLVGSATLPRWTERGSEYVV
jgi:hypothetical protein